MGVSRKGEQNAAWISLKRVFVVAGCCCGQMGWDRGEFPNWEITFLNK